MRYEVVIPPTVVKALRRFRAIDRVAIRDAIEKYLRRQPNKPRGSRIKRLRGFRQPQYRLRVGDELRVLYNVTGGTVEVLAALTKDEVGPWLEDEGAPE